MRSNAKPLDLVPLSFEVKTQLMSPCNLSTACVDQTRRSCFQRAPRYICIGASTKRVCGNFVGVETSFRLFKYDANWP